MAAVVGMVLGALHLTARRATTGTYDDDDEDD